MTLLQIVLWHFAFLFILNEIRIRRIENRLRKLETMLEGKVIITDLQNITAEDQIVLYNKVK